LIDSSSSSVHHSVVVVVVSGSVLGISVVNVSVAVAVVVSVDVDPSGSSRSSIFVVVKSVHLVLFDQGFVELVSYSLACRPEVESEGCEVNVVKESDEPCILEKNEN